MELDLHPSVRWKPEMELELHGGCFFLKITKMAIICFQKIETIFLDVHNVEIYEPAKFQFKILCILGYRKKRQN
jgi:hypothetical protein